MIQEVITQSLYARVRRCVANLRSLTSMILVDGRVVMSNPSDNEQANWWISGQQPLRGNLTSCLSQPTRQAFFLCSS
jgi:hypothetical protein